MKLQCIRITNHSRLADLDLEIREHAVVIGANDVGKTSLLRALNFLLGATVSQLYQQIGTEDIDNPSEPLVIEGEFGDLTEAEWAIFPQEISVPLSGEGQLILRVRLEVVCDDSDPSAVTISRRFPDSGHDRAPSRLQLENFSWRYLPASRAASVSQLSGPNSALQVLLEPVDLGAEQAKLAGLLENFNETLSANKKIEDLRQDIAGHLSRAMPREIGKDDLAVRTASDPSRSVLNSTTVFFKKEDEHISITDQSDGIRQLLLMTLFDLAQGTANIIAIDEPELHLHPSSQRTIAQLFLESGNQKVLATHSPYIVQKFDPAQVIVIDADRVSHQVDSRRRTQVEKALVQWWSPRLLEVLTARCVIVVEGLADRVIVEACADQMGLALDRIGAIVFELDGAEKFQHVYKLIGPGGFNIPVLGLVDRQESSSWVNLVGGKPATVIGRKIWISDPDLEGEYCKGLGGERIAQILIEAGVCTEKGFLNACHKEKLSEVSPDSAASFCRKGGRKVSCATALAAYLGPSEVLKLQSVSELLAELSSRSSGYARR